MRQNSVPKRSKGVPFSGETYSRLFGTSFAEGEQFSDDLLSLGQDQSRAGLQVSVAPLQREVRRPVLGDGGHVQELVGGQAFQEAFEFICNRDKGERVARQAHVQMIRDFIPLQTTAARRTREEKVQVPRSLKRLFLLVSQPT